MKKSLAKIISIVLAAIFVSQSFVAAFAGNPPYYLTYDLNAADADAKGCPTDPVESDASGKVILISDENEEELPTRDGYRIVGWSDSAGENNSVDYDFGQAVYLNGSDKTVYAVWGGTLTYVLNGGENGPDNLEEPVKGKIKLSTVEPQRGEDAFLGWAATLTDATETDPLYAPGADFSVNRDTNLYAFWGYYLYYSANDGDNAPNPDKGKGEITISNQKPEKENHTFLGWATETNPSAADYQPGDKIDNFNQNMTLTAVWGGTVHFNLNGGKDGPKDFVARTNNSATIIPYKTPLRTGYDFLGWSINQQATEPDETYAPGSEIIVDKDLTLYAVWIKDSSVSETYKISYDPNGGKYGPADGEYSGTFDLPYDYPSRNGYTFLGWSENKSATVAKYRPGDSFSLGKDTTLYAVWKKNDNSYLNNSNWTDMSTSQMDVKFDKMDDERDPYSQEELEDKYIAVFYSENSDRSKNIGTGLLTQWMDEYDCPLYGVNIHDDKNNISDWARLAYAKKTDGKEINPSVIAFVERIELKDGRGNVVKAITNFDLYNDPDSIMNFINEYNAKQTDNTKKIVTDEHFDEIYAIATTDSRYSEFKFILDGLDFEDDTTEGALKDEFFDFWGYSGEYSLTYDLNADDASNEPESKSDLKPGSYKLSTQVPVRNEYVFDGWSETKGAANGEYKPGAKYFLTKDTVLYAIWKHDPLAVRNEDNWHESTRDEIDELYYREKKGVEDDNFIVFFYDPSSEDCKTIITSVIDPWITAEGTDYKNPDGFDYSKVYAVDVRNYSIPDWAYGDGSKSVSVPLITFVGYWDHPEPYPGNPEPKVKAYTGLSSNGKENLKESVYAVSFIDENVYDYFLRFTGLTNEYEITYNLNDPENQNDDTDIVSTQRGYGVVRLDAEDSVYPKNVYEDNTKNTDYTDNTKYKFLGWSEDATARPEDYKKNDKFSLHENVTLYAIWQENAPRKYTITYDVDGGYGPINLQAEKGWVKLSDVIPTKKGYKFAEWSDSETGNTYNPGDDFYLEKDVTLVAMWNDVSKEYTLKFDLNDGESRGKDFSDIKGSGYVNLPPDAPFKNDYTFDGWSTVKDGAAQYKAGTTYNLTADTTLYACWSYAHTTGGMITYYANGGTIKTDDLEVVYKEYEGIKFAGKNDFEPAPKEQYAGMTVMSFTESVFQEEDITLTPVKPTRFGYTFLGWSYSAAAKSAQFKPGNNFYLEEGRNVKLYAVWIDNESLLKVLTLPKSEYVLTLGESVTVSYGVNTDFEAVLVAESPDEGVVNVSDNNGKSFVMTGTGVGEKEITLTLYDKDKNEVYAVRYINVKVQKAERFSLWKWIINLFRKLFSWLKPLFS